MHTSILTTDTAERFYLKHGYQKLPGWKTDIMGATEWDELPAEAKAYVEYIEKLIECPITMISTGPDRKHMIYRY